MTVRGKILALAVVASLLLAWMLISGNLALGLVVIILPAFLALVVLLFRNPIIGIYLTIIWAFLGIGIKRYILSESGSALGLGVDILLVVTWLIYFLNRFHESFDSKALRNGIVACSVIWFGYNILELVNLEAPTFIGWFYAVRGVALYMILTVPLIFLLVKDKKTLYRVMAIWFALSVLGVLWGMKQLYVGLDYAENIWLSEPGNRTTHLLFGKLRVFSFYSDSGQFGAALGHAGIVGLVLAIQWQGRKRIYMGVLSLLFFYGMLISGTRGAMAVPVIGGIAFLLLKRNWRLLMIGVSVMALAFGTLKYTSIGSGIYEIQRMRTALDPNNASLQVRLENQKKLIEYLKSHPLGGGVGSAGYWGLRFNPNSFLANLALDSWYVKIAAEQGIPGLIIFVGFVLYFLIAGYRRVSNMADAELQPIMIALYAGVAGIAVASYGNQVWGQMPTGIIIYFSIAAIWQFSAPKSLSMAEADSSNQAG